MALQSIKYERGSLHVLNQLLLPGNTEYIDVKDTRDGWDLIKKMKVIYSFITRLVPGRTFMLNQWGPNRVLLISVDA